MAQVRGTVCDFDNPAEKRRAIGLVVERMSGMAGPVEVGEDRGHVWAKKRYRQRTLKQNAYLHGVLLPYVQELIIREWGEEDATIDDAKLAMRERFLREERTRVLPDGTVRRWVRIRHTPEADTQEFQVFLGRIKDLLAEYAPDIYQRFLRDEALYRGEEADREFEEEAA